MLSLFFVGAHIAKVGALKFFCATGTNSRGKSDRDEGDGLRQLFLREAGFVAFLGVNGGEIELVHGMVMPNAVTAFSLETRYDPIAAFFGLGKGI